MYDVGLWYFGDVWYMVQKCVYQCIVLVFIVGMDNQIGWFVDDDQCFVFENDVEWDIFWLFGNILGIVWFIDDQLFVVYQFVFGFVFGFVIDLYVVVMNLFLQVVVRVLWEYFSQYLIEVMVVVGIRNC